MHADPVQFPFVVRVPTFRVKMLAQSQKWKSGTAACFQMSVSQSAITYAKVTIEMVTIETLEQGVKYVQS